MANRTDDEHKGHRKRLRQNYLKAGALDCFHEHQILEMLLFYAIPRKDVNPLAHRLIDHFGSLYDVLNADYNALIKFGLSENTAALIKLTKDIPKTAERNMMFTRTILSTSDAMDFCFGLLGNLRNEKICVICLNSVSKLLHYEMISVGDPTKTYFSPRNIVEIAVSHGASGIILAHNHPSGNCQPSKTDIESTSNLQKILMQIGISLQEHIIVAFPNCYAMRRGISKNMLSGKLLSGASEECLQAVNRLRCSQNAFKDSSNGDSSNGDSSNGDSSNGDSSNGDSSNGDSYE